MITNGDLIKILQRFPVEGAVKLRRYDSRGASQGELLDVDRAEMQIDASPTRLTAQNVAWADMVKEKIQVVLIFGSPKEAEPAQDGSKIGLPA
jgi:hypothetical protein